MYQTVVFQGTKVLDLEKEMNKWLWERKGIILGPINQSSAFVPEDMVVVTITIFYKTTEA